MTVRPAKTPISLGIRPVWSESSLCAQWVAKEPSFLHADSEDSDQTGRMPRLIWVRWAHMPFCWFCHEAAHIPFQLVNKEMFWVVTEIVNESNLVKRMKIMKHFIKIASKFCFSFFEWKEH